jgi:hypothetical protein
MSTRLFVSLWPRGSAPRTSAVASGLGACGDRAANVRVTDLATSHNIGLGARLVRILP